MPVPLPFPLPCPSCSERDLVRGKFKQILDGCARGLNLPLTLNDSSTVIIADNLIAQKTLLALIWDLGGDPSRVQAAKVALRVFCSLLANRTWEVSLSLSKRKSTGGATAAASSTMSPTNTNGLAAMNENIAVVLQGAFNFFVWHLAQLKFKERPHCEQEQSVRAVLAVVGLLKQEDLSKFLPKIMMVLNSPYPITGPHIPSYSLTCPLTQTLTHPGNTLEHSRCNQPPSDTGA